MMKHLLPKFVFTVNVAISYIGARYLYDLFESEGLQGGWLTASGVAAFCLIYCGVNFTLYMLGRKRIVENTPILEVNEEEGHIFFPGEEGHKIPWKNVEKIEIFTSDDGPWSEDLWWLFYLKDREDPIDVPNGSKGIAKIFDVLKSQFDNAKMEEIAKAIGSTNVAVFEIWTSQ